jgi:hypothetical protein
MIRNWDRSSRERRGVVENLDRQVSAIWEKNGAEATRLVGKWARELEDAVPWIRAAKKRLHAWRSLAPHVSVTRAGRVHPSGRVTLSLRFHGNEVAEVGVAQNIVRLRVTERHVRSKRSRGAVSTLGPLPVGDYPWSGDRRTQKFKTYFSDLDRAKGRELLWLECRVQSDLNARMMGLGGKKEAALRWKRPVLLGGYPLQVPLPMQANKGVPVFSQGGHVDILARHGRGRSGHPAVWELKRPDEISSAVPQAYIYSVTLLHIFRSPGIGTRWYGLLGFGGSLPKSITIDAVVAVFKEQKPALLEQFSEYQPAMPSSIGGDHIRFYAAYYDVSTGRLAIDSLEPLG